MQANTEKRTESRKKNEQKSQNTSNESQCSTLNRYAFASIFISYNFSFQVKYAISI